MVLIRKIVVNFVVRFLFSFSLLFFLFFFSFPFFFFLSFFFLLLNNRRCKKVQLSLNLHLITCAVEAENVPAIAELISAVSFLFLFLLLCVECFITEHFSSHSGASVTDIR